ncbi:MAG: PAS domain S-box protein [Halobacteriota archaeon]
MGGRDREVTPVERQLLEGLPVMSILTRLVDDEVVVEACNDRFAEELGYDRDEIRGRPLADFYTEESYDELVDGGFDRAIAGEFDREERQLLTRDETVMYALIRAVPRRMDGTETVGSRAVYVDITERRRQAERFEVLIEHTTDVITVVDDRLTITYQSPSIREVLGYAPDELLGEDPFDYIHPDDRDLAAETFLDVTTSAEPTIDRLEFRFRHRDGSWVWLETVGSNETNTAVDGFVMTSRDVTDRKHREQQLQVLNRVMRHNMRNDVNLITGHAADLADELDDESLRRSATKILQTADGWASLIEKASQIESLFQSRGGVSTVDVTRLVRLVTTDVQANHPTVEQEVSVPESGAYAVDERLRIALRELCENAIQHSETDAPWLAIRVHRVEAEPSRITLSVSDRGPGLPPHERDVLQGVEETPLAHGSGIGLWLVELLVGRIGGDVSVEDNDPWGVLSPSAFR